MGNLNWSWLSPVVYLIPIFRLGVYLMKVIHKRMMRTNSDIHVLIIT
jgi:hypothetical protein